MEPIEYLQVLRRRWLLIVAAGLIAATAAWVTTPIDPDGAPEAFEATHTLYRDPGTTEESSLSLATVALLARTGEIPQQVAAEVAPGTEPALLAEEIVVEADEELGTVVFTATDENPDRAQLLADAFAEETLAFFDAREQLRQTQVVDRLTRRAQDLEARILELDAELAPLLPDDPTVEIHEDAEIALLRAERDALVRQYGVVQEQLEESSAAASSPSTLVTLQSATPIPADPEGLQPPQGRPARAAVAGVIGLLLGTVLAFALERVDTRLRTRRDAEEAFRLPVISEVPRVLFSGNHEMLVASRPNGYAAEAYRIVRLSLEMPPRWVPSLPGATNGNAKGNGMPAAVHPAAQRLASQGERASRVVLVTSPGAGEGKSTTVANLAVAFAEVGKQVLVIDCDFRHADQHRFFRTKREPGLTDYLGSEDGQGRLSRYANRTNTPGVWLVANGTFAENPGQLRLDNGLIERASQLADVVLIDAGPILSVNDPAALVPQVDSVVVVGRSGHTTTAQAARTAELLARLEAPAVGVTMVGVPRSASGQPYYAQLRSTPAAMSRWPWQRHPRPARPSRSRRVPQTPVRESQHSGRG